MSNDEHLNHLQTIAALLNIETSDIDNGSRDDHPLYNATFTGQLFTAIVKKLSSGPTAISNTVHRVHGILDAATDDYDESEDGSALREQAVKAVGILAPLIDE